MLCKPRYIQLDKENPVHPVCPTPKENEQHVKHGREINAIPRLLTNTKFHRQKIIIKLKPSKVRSLKQFDVSFNLIVKTWETTFSPVLGELYRLDEPITRRLNGRLKHQLQSMGTKSINWGFLTRYHEDADVVVFSRFDSSNTP